MIIVDKQKHVEKKSKWFEAVSSIEPTVQATNCTSRTVGSQSWFIFKQKPAIY